MSRRGSPALASLIVAGFLCVGVACGDDGGGGGADASDHFDGGGACAVPEIHGATGTFHHGEGVTLTGCGFGVKDPAPPLVWDDCEGRTVEDQAAVLAHGWADPWPRSGGVTSHHIQYRGAGFRNTEAPHALSSQYLAGGHYQYPGNVPAYIGDGAEDYRNVTVTADAGLGRPRWFAIWYYRLDPLWPTPCPPMNNHKVSVVQPAGASYTGGAFSYVVYRAQAPCSPDPDPVQFAAINNGNCDNGAWPADFPPVSNPRLAWVHHEEHIADDDILGFRDVYVDNQRAVWSHENCPNWFNGQGGDYATGIRSFSIGGYYRWATDIDDTATYRGDENAFRYFDDIYIDDTLARVMLADHADYAQATVVEPQLPSAWNDTAITVSLNLGRLAQTQTAYLFVFNEDNLRVVDGYPIALSP